MGWVVLSFFIFLFLLLLAPFFLPVRVRLHMHDKSPDWSIHYGPQQVAPDTVYHLDRTKKRVMDAVRVPLLVLAFLWKLIRLPVQGIVGVVGGLVYLFHQLTKGVRILFARRQKGVSFSEDTEQAGHDVERAASGAEEWIREKTPPGETREDSEGGEAFGAGRSGEVFDGETDDDSDTIWGDEDAGAENDTEGLTGSAFGERIEQPVGRDDEETAGKAGSPLRDMRDRLSRLSRQLREYRQLVGLYAPIARKVFRRLLLFLRRCSRAFTMRALKAHLTLGGDPATLGALQGWHHALAGTIPRRPEHQLRFEADYESETFAPRGTLDLDLVIWPYRFILPTLTLIVTLPWFSVYRAVRRHKRSKSERGANHE